MIYHYKGSGAKAKYKGSYGKSRIGRAGAEKFFHEKRIILGGNVTEEIRFNEKGKGQTIFC